MRSPKFGMRARLGALALLVIIAASWSPVSRHVRAAKLLTHFADANAKYPDIDVTSFTLDTPNGPTRAKMYTPHGSTNLPGMVVIPGVHHLGVDEPRLQRFAGAISASGVVVMTPEVKELTDYRIEPKSIATIGAAATELSKRTLRKGVGVMGLSFAGGLSLLAAANPETNANISFVVAVGAHDDIRHVARFFAKDEAIEPNGNVVHMHAHPYGIMVLAYEHADDFFDKADVTNAEAAMRLWLWEDKDAARSAEKKMNLADQAKFDLLAEPPQPPANSDPKSASFSEHPMANEILGVLTLYGQALDEVSPHGHLASIHVPVFLVHGEGDDVIPMTETEWLEQDVPAEQLQDALISPALHHVELHGEPSAGEKWKLVHFMARVLDAAQHETHN
jgi:dienelactone hydrolase